MLLNYLNKIIFLILLSIFLVSCSSMKELEHYPIREIEKPHTLPQGVLKSDFTGVIFVESQGDVAAGYMVPPLPFYTQYSFSDDLMVNFFLF
ncbi:hypothetical protein JXR93_06415, partial [bacterium]|nr:hypothetical protein [bacterium]